jgi:hypothetical protein
MSDARSAGFRRDGGVTYRILQIEAVSTETAAKSGPGRSLDISFLDANDGVTAAGVSYPGQSHTSAAQLLRDLTQQSYAGAYALGAAHVRRVRQAQCLAPRQRLARQPLPVVAESRYHPLTPRRAPWLVPRREEQRMADEAEKLSRWPAQQDYLSHLLRTHEAATFQGSYKFSSFC